MLSYRGFAFFMRLPFWQNKPKNKENGHYFGEKFVLAITFYKMHIFRNRFLCWSAFLLDFKKTPIKTIFMAITYVCHNSQYWKMAITAVMACICYGNKFGRYGCLFKIQQKCRSSDKTVSKNMQLVKSYGQNKFVAKWSQIIISQLPNPYLFGICGFRYILILFRI